MLYSMIGTQKVMKVKCQTDAPAPGLGLDNRVAIATVRAQNRNVRNQSRNVRMNEPGKKKRGKRRSNMLKRSEMLSHPSRASWLSMTRHGSKTSPKRWRL